jgi:hypothetical protein
MEWERIFRILFPIFCFGLIFWSEMPFHGGPTV